MSVTATNLVFYASQNMPQDDTSPAGGAINSGVRVVFEDIPITGTITAYSNNVADSGNLTVVGRNNAGVIVSDIFGLSGTTPVSGSQVFERILSVQSSAVATGNITIEETVSNSGIGTIYANEQGFLRPFYDATAEPFGGSNKVLYEKIFLKNNNPINALLSASITEISSGVFSVVDFGLEKVQQYGEFVANRTTAPTGVTSYGDGPSGIAGTNLDPLSYQGVWLRLTLNAGTAATNSFYQLRVQGSTT